jgi:hypothetical protein
MSRLLLPLALALALGLGAQAAHAAPASPLEAPQTLLDAALSAPAGTRTAACHAAYRPGAAGVATRSVAVPGPGAVKVTLAGDDGDWDVAVFDEAGRVVAADASADAQ